MRFASALTCVAALAWGAAPRRAALERAFPEVEKVFERFQRQRGIPGLVFGVVIDGELALAKGLGVRDRAAGDRVTPDTVFRIASMTKSFTALAVLKLRDEGKLSLDDPVEKWIPEFVRMPYPTRDTAPIRVRQLLTHGAGFPEDNPWGDRQLAQSEVTLTRWLEAGIPFSTPPDTAYEYSNYGFALAGRVVARASGVPYREYLEKQILAPLGMRSSTLEPVEVPANLRATGYTRAGAEEPQLAHGAFGAMGGLLTSARDLARYIAYQLSAHPPRDEEDRGPVRRSSLREMQSLWRPGTWVVDRTSPDAPLRASAGGYGFGLAVWRDCRFAHVVGHGGGLPGFGSYMLWLPDYGVGLFVMANQTYAGPRPAIEEALEVLHKSGGLEPRRAPPVPVLTSTRDAIARLWRHWDNGQASALAADNLFLDRPAEERRKEMDRMKAELGVCRAPGEVDPENLLRGRFRMPCEQGFVEFTFTLAPTNPPRLQHLSLAVVKPLGEKMRAAAEAVAAATRSGAAPQGVEGRQLEAVRLHYGACRLGEPVSGDGARSARVLLECERGRLELTLATDAAGRLQTSFHRPPQVACMQ